MRIVKIISILPLLLLINIFVLAFPKVSKAQEINCSNRVVTYVNPVRARSLWGDPSTSPLTKQYEVLAGKKMPATWLLQYDVLKDKDIISTIKNFQIKGEEGLFLEVSKGLADDANVTSPIYVRWSDPGIVFLSAYSQSERRALIDKAYSKFKDIFGYYPKSVGAWWIDSYSLNYIKEKYGLDAVMIVADQKTTDSYGVWGQWWGVPYIPTKENILFPAVDEDNLGSVVIQWAQRDPTLAYGEGPIYSNFSLQANDYIRSGKNTSYFLTIARKYLDCGNKVGQITVGLETGMESVVYLNEYKNQVNALSNIKSVKALTMSDFANLYKSVYPENPLEVKVGDWVMTPDFRENKKLGDRVNYTKGISFSDFFTPDKNGFLNRNLDTLENFKPDAVFPVFALAVGFVSLILLLKKKYSVLVWSALTGLSVFGLIFRSYNAFGWTIYYGPVVNQLVLLQCLLVLGITALGLYIFSKKTKLDRFFYWLIPATYGLDWVLSLFRYTKIEGSHHFGILIDRVYFTGIIIARGINFVYSKYPPNVSGAFLQIPLYKIQENLLLIILSFGVHAAFAYLIYRILARSKLEVKYAVLLGLLILLVFEILGVFTSDPRVVFPVK